VSASSRASFTSAIDLIGRGKLDEAEAVCRGALARNADDINMLGLLGVLLVKRRRYAEGEQILRRTIDLAPAFAKPHEDLGALCSRRIARRSARAPGARRAPGSDPGIRPFPPGPGARAPRARPRGGRRFRRLLSPCRRSARRWRSQPSIIVLGD
jgi:hypothetical protein